MKTPKKLFAIIVMMQIFLSPKLALAYSNAMEGHGGKFLLKGIELSEEQKSKMKEVRKNNKAKHRSSKKDNMEMRESDRKQVQSFILSDNFDEDEIRAFVDKRAKEQADKRFERLRNQHELFSVLTPEQKQQVKANMDQQARRSKDKMKRLEKKKAMEAKHKNEE